ncbi:hypothetical protein BPAE_0155g00180 [Botrytis paeoniae]|uniref:Uncharacterized protein n=1 Tax=Botrytis paeoniae TaxID=278948 RepID=A0A4Z1FGS6_9HELO|nr:hypothetical protein BPAE_0155g00180 [Botrytis paeoniae]
MASQVKFFVALCFILINVLVNVQGYEFTIGPHADVDITKFEATLTVPPFSKDGRHQFGAGCTNQAHNYAHENRLSDHNPGKWEVDMMHGSVGIATDNNILPGDKIHSTFEHNTATHVTINNVTIVPGPQSINAGQKTRTKIDVVNIPQEVPTAGKLNVVRLYFRPSGGAVWDFGPIVRENVIITSRTTDASWCSRSWKISDDLSVTGGNVYWGEGDQTMCQTDRMTWEPSKKGN